MNVIPLDEVMVNLKLLIYFILKYLDNMRSFLIDIIVVLGYQFRTNEKITCNLTSVTLSNAKRTLTLYCFRNSGFP